MTEVKRAAQPLTLTEPHERTHPLQGRVMLVGPPEVTAALERVLGQVAPASQPVIVDGYMMALGEAAVMPPEVVLGDVHTLADDTGSIVNAFHQLASDVRLIVVAPEEAAAQARQALAAGFDQMLMEPVKPDELARVLASVPAAPDRPASAGERPGGGSDASPVAPAPTELQGHLLGDIDLVDRLLHHEGAFHETALQVIRERTGIEDVQWTTRAAGLELDRTAVPVEHDRQRLGVLHAPLEVGRQTLTPWAAWLGHWLALHRKMSRLRRLAMTDDVTELGNRRYFEGRLEAILARAREERFRVTLMVFDIDNFKRYNDRYGHAAGDDILRETGRLMRCMIRKHDVVARIGGDEFAVIFWDAEKRREPESQHPQDVLRVAQRFQQAICEHKFPKLLDAVPETITISAGLAGYPWDGRTPEELYNLADQMALQSKRNGKNALTLGPGAQRGTE